MNDRPVRLVVDDDRRRSRLTVFFRLFLAIPHFFWLASVDVRGLLHRDRAVVRDRRPRAARPIRCRTSTSRTSGTRRTSAPTFRSPRIPFPGFLGEPGYPIDVELDAAERQPRLTAAFRLLLALPALFFLALVNGGGSAGNGGSFAISGGVVLAAAFLGWFACLVRGEMPHGLRNVAAYGLRYTAEVYAYLLLVTPTYPTSRPDASRVRRRRPRSTRSPSPWTTTVAARA